MKLNSEKYEKRIWLILVISPILYSIVITSLILAAKEHNLIHQQLPGLVIAIIIALIVFSLVAYNLKIAVKSLELINDELRITSPKFGFIILKRENIYNISFSNNLICPISYLTINDSSNRKHRLIIPPWIEKFSSRGNIDVRQFILDWWSSNDIAKTLPKIGDLDLIKNKRKH